MDVSTRAREGFDRVGVGDPEENRNLQFSCWTLHIDGIVFRMCRRVPLRSFKVPSTRRPLQIESEEIAIFQQGVPLRAIFNVAEMGRFNVGEIGTGTNIGV